MSVLDFRKKLTLRRFRSDFAALGFDLSNVSDAQIEAAVRRFSLALREPEPSDERVEAVMLALGRQMTENA